MDDERLYFKLVNYSEKSIALLIERDGVLTDYLTDIGGKYNYRLQCGPGFIFPRKKSYDELIRLLDYFEIMYKTYELADLDCSNRCGSSNNRNNSHTGRNRTPEFILTDDERKQWIENSDLPDWYYKEYPIVVRLSGGEVVAIESDRLQTEFWHHDEGPDYDEHCSVTENEQTQRAYFIAENTSKLQGVLDRLKGVCQSSYKYLWLIKFRARNEGDFWQLQKSSVCPDATNAVDYLDEYERGLYDKGFYKPLSDDDKQRLITAYELAIEKQTKRCNTWLKRYGTEKLSFRTYWADR